ENGNYFKAELNKLKEELPGDIKDVRGKGYMLGVELYYEASPVVKAMRERKVLSNATNVNVIRILPPLIATKENIDLYLSVLKDAIKNK
ncbi:MAG: aminotransferase class III-fold pyridoxal phosphate-dependent enzyme, partial [Bacteroidota bacterium]